MEGYVLDSRLLCKSNFGTTYYQRNLYMDICIVVMCKAKRIRNHEVSAYICRRPGKREKDIEHLEMDGFVVTSNFISSVLIFTALIYIPQGSPNQCRPPLIKTVYVEIGDEISILGQFFLGSEYHGGDLIWKKYGGDPTAVCNANQMTHSEEDWYTFDCNILMQEFPVEIGTCRISCCTLNVFIANALQSDFGIHFLQTTGPDSRLLMVVNVIVIETKQTCSANHPKDSEYLQMTCHLGFLKQIMRGRGLAAMKRPGTIMKPTCQ